MKNLKVHELVGAVEGTDNNKIWYTNFVYEALDNLLKKSNQNVAYFKKNIKKQVESWNYLPT